MINKLKHYLGTGLKVQYINCMSNRKITSNLTGVNSEGIETTYTRKINGISGDYISWKGNNNFYDLKVKPHLRPLSKLTESIKVKGYNDGKDFVPADELNDILRANYGEEYSIYTNPNARDYFHVNFNFFSAEDDNGVDYKAILLVHNFLHRWHFNLHFSEGEFIEI